jgi:hypothetical protein
MKAMLRLFPSLARPPFAAAVAAGHFAEAAA